ncbi:MAG TPA: hypothetical protein VNM37_11775, partial [Candidatus Dormibacteraeota bacterium]|nr:hypothetical protein [Candidatus Dormibacteraeota bacterium]
QQAQAQQMAQHLAMSEQAAKVDDIRAAAKLKSAQADKISAEAQAPPEQADPRHGFLMAAAALRTANAQAATAEANAGIAFFNLSQLGDPRALEARALTEEANALSAHAGATVAMHTAPLQVAHSMVDLHTKMNPPEATEPAEGKQPETAEADG